MLLTTLCYVEKDGCYLMMLRNKKENDPSAGKWIGAGGKVEPGETRDECVVREVLEETGLRLNSVTYRGVVHFHSEIFYRPYILTILSALKLHTRIRTDM